MKVYHTTVAKKSGETLAEAIGRAAVFAANNGYDGYEIRCGGCNEKINKCICGGGDRER